jgi:hypothetical protein
MLGDRVGTRQDHHPGNHHGNSSGWPHSSSGGLGHGAYLQPDIWRQ